MSNFQNPIVLLKQKNVNLPCGNLLDPQNNIFQKGLKERFMQANTSCQSPWIPLHDE